MLKGHEAAVTDVIFAPDGRNVASASADGVVSPLTICCICWILQFIDLLDLVGLYQSYALHFKRRCDPLAAWWKSARLREINQMSKALHAPCLRNRMGFQVRIWAPASLGGNIERSAVLLCGAPVQRLAWDTRADKVM